MTKAIHQLTAAQLDKLFSDEDACAAYLVARRWPDGVHCPRCGNPAVYDLASRKWHWQCTQCAPGGSSGYRFSHLVGTIFENTNKPLKDWFCVIHLMLTSKKGMSVLQIYRFLGFGSYKTAWHMCHRIRTALAEREFEKFGGIVEVDETFVGGEAKKRHRSDGDGQPGGTASGKSIVARAVRRKGSAVARVIANVSRKTLEGFVCEAVSTKVSLLCTDQWVGNHHLNREFPHRVVDHSLGEYVVGAVCTNTIKGFWSLIKRGMVETFHKVSNKYLPLYVAEFQLRYNHRSDPNIFEAGLRQC